MPHNVHTELHPSQLLQTKNPKQKPLCIGSSKIVICTSDALTQTDLRERVDADKRQRKLSLNISGSDSLLVGTNNGILTIKSERGRVTLSLAGKAFALTQSTLFSQREALISPCHKAFNQMCYRHLHGNRLDPKESDPQFFKREYDDASHANPGDVPKLLKTLRESLTMM